MQHGGDGGVCVYLQGLVLPIGETSEGRQEVDVCALDKLLLRLAELLLSLATPEQGHPCRHSVPLGQYTHLPREVSANAPYHLDEGQPR